jgi:hypothetical protein
MHAACIHTRVVNSRILRKVDLLTGIVHVTRATESSRAYDSPVNAGGLHAECSIVHVIASLRVNVSAVPSLRAVFVL